MKLLRAAALGLIAGPALTDMDATRALIAQHSELPIFTSPGDPCDAKQCMAEKKMFVIPLTNANPFNAAISQGFVDAAEMVGFALRDRQTQITATSEPSDFMDAAANTDCVTIGRIIAAWAMVQTKGRLNALVIGPDEITPTAPPRDAIIDFLADNCPDCTTRYINVPVNNWATRGQPAVQNALLQDPSRNCVLQSTIRRSMIPCRASPCPRSGSPATVP